MCRELGREEFFSSKKAERSPLSTEEVAERAGQFPTLGFGWLLLYPSPKTVRKALLLLLLLVVLSISRNREEGIFTSMIHF